MLFIIASILFGLGLYHLADTRQNGKEINLSGSKNGTGGISGEEKSSSSFNILFLGGDRVYNNTDTIILANIDPVTYKATLLSIPRDTRVTIEGRTRKLNFAYPRGGGALAVDTVEKLLEVNIDHYIFIDLAVFREAIDLLGGVEYYVPEDMSYDDPTQNLHIRLKKGYQVLDGRKAEYLVRYRKGYKSGDIGRIKVQQDFIAELLRQKLTLDNIPRLRDVAVMIFDHLETNISLSKVLQLILLADKFDVSNLQFFRMPGTVTDGRSWFFIPDMEQVSAIIRQYFNTSR